jgi:hypothetical protein
MGRLDTFNKYRIIGTATILGLSLFLINRAQNQSVIWLCMWYIIDCYQGSLLSLRFTVTLYFICHSQLIDHLWLSTVTIICLQT